MQPLDPHTLFSIFEKGDAEVYEEHNMTELLDNPYVLMGMVLRGVDNYHTMDVINSITNSMGISTKWILLSLRLSTL